MKTAATRSAEFYEPASQRIGRQNSCIDEIRRGLKRHIVDRFTHGAGRIGDNPSLAFDIGRYIQLSQRDRQSQLDTETAYGLDFFERSVFQNQLDQHAE